MEPSKLSSVVHTFMDANIRITPIVDTQVWHNSPGWLKRRENDFRQHYLLEVLQQLLAHQAERSFSTIWSFVYKLRAKRGLELLSQGLVCGVNVAITEHGHQPQHCLAGCSCIAPAALLFQKGAKCWTCKSCRQALQ